MADLHLSDGDLEVFEALERTLEEYCHGPLTWRPLTDETLRALGGLPVAAQERLVLSLPPAARGPHAHIATPAVAALGVELLMVGDRFLGTEILEGMRESDVEAALRARDALSSTDPRVLSWTLPRGLADGGDITRVVALEAPVLDVAIVEEAVFASCRDGSLHRFTDDEHTVLAPPGDMDDPAARLATTACRLVAVTPSLIVRWGWEHMVALDRDDGSRRWEIELGHGFDQHVGRLPVFGHLVDLGEGLFVDLNTGTCLSRPESEDAAATVQARRAAGDEGVGFGPRASRGDLDVEGTPDGLVIWRD
ncbi:MAG: hypothetical protein SangKO_057790 [Sandaracinaceae bacterium]